MFLTTTIDVLPATIASPDNPWPPVFPSSLFTFFNDSKRRLRHHHYPIHNRFRANRTNMHCAKLFNVTLPFGIDITGSIVIVIVVVYIYIQYTYIVVCCVRLPAHKSFLPLFTFFASLSHLTPCRSFLSLFMFIVGH